MRPQAIVWSGLDRNTDTFGLGLLRESDGLVDIGSGEARKSVVKLSDEGMPVSFRHRHKGPSHDAVREARGQFRKPVWAEEKSRSKRTYMIST
jgi:hypothetical protein